MNIPNPTGAQAWRTGYEDGTHGRQDAAFYNRADDDARCYRDGHRMARRELADADLKAIADEQCAPIKMEIETIIEPGGEVKTKYVAPLDERAARVAPPVPGERLPTSVDPAAELNKIWDKGPGGTPSSFVDPTPGKRRAKQPKPPADAGQQSLF